MSQHRFNAKRDENEPDHVELARSHGRHVTRLNGDGVPDLLVIKPGHDLPVYIVENLRQMMDVITAGDDICLVEVKMPGKKLNANQIRWWQECGAL